MEVLINEPTAIYSQSTRVAETKRIFSIRNDSSIFLSRPTEFSEIVAVMIQKLSRLHTLSENWDSYHADAPSPVAISNAQYFLIDNHYLSLPFYFLAPGVNGEVMIEFKKGILAAELYFLPDGTDELIHFEGDEVKFEGTLSEGFKRLIAFFNP